MKEDGTLQFIPIKEIESLRVDAWNQETIIVSEKKTDIKAGDGISFEWKMQINLEETNADQLEIGLRCGEGKKTICIFDFKNAQMSVNRNEADGWSKGISKSVMYLKDRKELDVHILSDQSSIEIFTDDYQNNHSLNVFAGNAQNQIYLCAHGGQVVINNLETYGLTGCNQ